MIALSGKAQKGDVIKGWRVVGVNSTQGLDGKRGINLIFHLNSVGSELKVRTV